MREIKTLEVARYSEPDDKGLVKYIGMISPQEAFQALETHLKEVGLMPDEYFNPNRWSWDGVKELPEYIRADCVTAWGGNEGIYIDITLLYRDDHGKLQRFNFATGKTLGSSGDDFLHMSRIAAECSMMLNGWGARVRVTEPEIAPDLAPEFTKAELVEMLEDLVHSPSTAERQAAAQRGYGLDRLVYDPAFQVRAEVALQGYGADILARDPEPAVRCYLAKSGQALDVLVNDKNVHVRCEVAKQGYGLMQLVLDPSEIVRAEVARQGCAIELLSADPDWFVRETLAGEGYALDVLEFDPVPSVQSAVMRSLRRVEMSIDEWVAAYPERCGLPDNRVPALDAQIAQCAEKAAAVRDKETKRIDKDEPAR